MEKNHHEEEELRYQTQVLGVGPALAVSIPSIPAADVRSRTWREGKDVPLFSDFLPAHTVKPWIQTLTDVHKLRYFSRLPESAAELASFREAAAAQHALAQHFGSVGRFAKRYGQAERIREEGFGSGGT